MGALTRDGETLTKTPEEDAERRWVALMMKTARKYHKLCPYFDKKTTQCLLMVTVEGRVGRCDRDGKYDGCPILVKFLERLYRYHVERGRVLPRDFQDVVNQAFIV
ncbi:MAG: hypothetical protein LM578_01750 [Desulfurococcaceae archaeon]|nr:hypothetical protein [Desulfurococcaceae archaeon]